MKKILLLGSGELGKELVISLKRLGCCVIACDSYNNAPAMQVSDDCEILNMLDGEELSKVIDKHKPDIIVPEIEAINTEVLVNYEANGFKVIPSANAVNLTMNRDRIRNFAANVLNVKTSNFRYAESLDSLFDMADIIGYPLVIKPVMSSSGKGQTIVNSQGELEKAWKYAIAGMRGDRCKIIVEEFINFDSEITLLTMIDSNGKVSFCDPIGHRQELGDYRESWQPHYMSQEALKSAKEIATKVVKGLGGVGIFGVEFFLSGDTVYFSELSPRPHDTGMVTLISQNLSEFDIHARLILNLPIPSIETYGFSVSVAILGDRDIQDPKYEGVDIAMKETGVDVRIFGKPVSRKNRRMGVLLYRDTNNNNVKAISNALNIAKNIKIV